MKEIRLEDYQAPDFFITSVKLHFQLFDHETLVTATSQVRKNLNNQADQVCLLGRDLELVEFKINGQVSLDHKVDLEHLRFKAPADPFEIQITTRIYPEKNKSFMGLYRSRALYATQMEPEGFRRVTYFVDRPDNMALFSTRIEADKKQFPVLLSNGNLIESGDLPAGRHYVEWRDPHLKPCYLFALVAGDLAVLEDSFTTMSQKKVALKIFTDPKYLDQCHHAMSSLKKSMIWDEQVFGREYDLDNFMIVAVDDFNFGAMENKGLNIYNAPYLLANAQTGEDTDFQNIEGVVAHEYFHNWSGNRVTLRDWFQISLKEGFTVFRDQEFSSDMNSRALQRIADVRFLRAQQFPEDAGPRSHPVQPKSYMTIDNFYTRTVYQKGGELIHMLKTLLGPEVFRKATDLYFKQNDGRSATTEDFVQSMERASGRDLKHFRQWYHQSGTPIVSVQTHYDGAKEVFELIFEQRTPLTADQREKTNLHIPIRMALLGANGHALPLIQESEKSQSPMLEKILELTEKKQSFRFVNVREWPVPSLFRRFSAPVKVEGLNNEQDLRF